MDRRFAFGLRLRAIRDARGMSQERFAELLDRSPDAISNMERGVNLPSMETLLRLSDALDVPLHSLFEGLEPLGPAEAKRARLLAAITEQARLLGTRDLEIVLKQIQAFPKSES